MEAVETCTLVRCVLFLFCACPFPTPLFKENEKSQIGAVLAPGSFIMTLIYYIFPAIYISPIVIPPYNMKRDGCASLVNGSKLINGAAHRLSCVCVCVCLFVLSMA